MSLVLIIEDSLTQSERLKYILEKNQYEVVVASNGEEAQVLMTQIKPMAIVSDVMMPKMSGYEFCHWLKRHSEYRSIPVILLTTLDTTEDVIKGLECEADFFIVKSTSDDMVLTRLRDIQLNRYSDIEKDGLVSFEVMFQNKNHVIKLTPLKMLNYLLSTYETAIQKNRELEAIEEKLTYEIECRKKLEADLKIAKETAESANRAKSIFLASMSHEIRTPMNAILGFSQLMLRDLFVTAEQKKRLDIINRSGEHLLSLINDILEISKIEAGKITINTKTFNLHSFLRDIENMFKARVSLKNLRLIFEEADDLLNYIITDEGKLRQIFLNVMSNAVKFTKEGGIAVRVKTEKIEDGYLLVCEIEDTGVGIEESEIDRLFETFQQTEAGINEGGTGLGLALSKQFANLLNGDITVKSIVGRGSCFKISIKVQEGNKEDIQEVHFRKKVVKVISEGDSNKILIVDDKPENREYLSEVLKAVGFVVLEAVDGKDAIAKFKAWSPDLILMDMRMPHMDGYEAARQIKALPKGQDTLIVIVTATAFDDDLHQLMDAGIEDELRKPFKISEVYEVVGKLLNVKYIYEDEKEDHHESNEDMKKKVIENIPKELLNRMHMATVNAQLDCLLSLIKESAEWSPETEEWLGNMANGFQYELLIDLFNNGGKET